MCENGTICPFGVYSPKINCIFSIGQFLRPILGVDLLKSQNALLPPFLFFAHWEEDC